MTDLLPCPFCGGPAVSNRFPRGVIGQIYCKNDDCFGPRTTAMTEADSIKQWNKRAPHPLHHAQTEKQPRAYWFEHPKYGIELSLDQLSEHGAEKGWTATPLYALSSTEGK